MNLLPRITGLAGLALLVSMAATTGASADTLKLDYSPTHPGGGFPGGTFQVSSVNGGLLAGSSPFDTFCLEAGEFFNPGGTYNYAVSSGAVSGGAGGVNGSDPISLGTAYLYDSYLRHGGDQKTIQQAIWWLENEVSTGISNDANGGEVCGPACQGLLAQLTSSLNKTDTELRLDCGSECYGVVALNLTYLSGGNAQDQLGRVPEAGATLLLAMSLAGLTWFARRTNVLGRSSPQVGRLA